jgi:molybdopterin-guanine dinucleotide biosynthesis protein A
MDAIVLAGGASHWALEGLAEGQPKALTRIGGLTLLEQVVAALRLSRGVERICVVAPETVRPLAADSGAALFVESGASAIGNIVAGAEALEASGAVLCVASDLPFLKPRDVDAVLDAWQPGHGICYPIVRRERWEVELPGAKATYVPLCDGEFVGTGVFILDVGVLARMQSAIGALFAARKSPAAMAKVFGPALALRFLAGKSLSRRLAPSLAQVVRRAEGLAGCSAMVLPECSSRMAFDIDCAEDLEYALARADGRQGHAPRDRS